MKLIGNLKKRVEKTASREEAREVIRRAGMLLTDEEMDHVSGGLGGPFVPGAQQGPDPSPVSQTSGIPAPSPSVSSADFGMACWKSDTMQHVFVKGDRGEEVCVYCGAARPVLK